MLVWGRIHEGNLVALICATHRRIDTTSRRNPESEQGDSTRARGDGGDAGVGEDQ